MSYISDPSIRFILGAWLQYFKEFHVDSGDIEHGDFKVQTARGKRRSIYECTHSKQINKSRQNEAYLNGPISLRISAVAGEERTTFAVSKFSFSPLILFSLQVHVFCFALNSVCEPINPSPDSNDTLEELKKKGMNQKKKKKNAHISKWKCSGHLSNPSQSQTGADLVVFFGTVKVTDKLQA